MLNNELQAGAEVDSSTTADTIPSASIAQNPMLPAVLSVGAKVYRTNYSQITDVIVIERVTKTQAIAKNGTYKFDVNVSSSGYVRKLGQTDRWSSASFYLETEELKQQLWQQQAIDTLKKTDFSKLSVETLKELLSVLNGR